MVMLLMVLDADTGCCGCWMLWMWMLDAVDVDAGCWMLGSRYVGLSVW